MHRAWTKCQHDHVSVTALSAARKKGVMVVRASRVVQGIVARNGEATTNSTSLSRTRKNAQKARILLMLALTKTSSSKEVQRMFYTY